MLLRTRFSSCVALLALLGVMTPPIGAEAPKPAVEPPLFEALVRSVTVDSISLSQIDVRLAVALRASRDVTVRRLAFRDSSVEGVPVWIDELAGEWRLRRDQELLLPDALRARAPTIDLLQMEQLAEAVRRRAVRVKTTVGVEVATPWSARLFFAGPTRSAIVQAEVEAPLGGADGQQPLVALAALFGSKLRNTLGSVTTGLRDLSPARRALVDAVTPSLATFTVAYEVVGRDGERQARERRTLGVAVRDSVLCTTREALEPWRFDVGDAVRLQTQGARLATPAPQLTVTWHRAGLPAASVDAADLAARLPRVRGRTLRTPVGDRVRRITLLDRDSRENLVCLSLPAGPSAQSPEAWRRGANAAGDEAAVFVARAANSPSLVWARVAEDGAGGAERLASPMSPASLGSPVVSAKGLVGMLVSDRGLRPAAELDAAATSPVAATVRR